MDVYILYFIAAWAAIGAVITPIVFAKKGRNPVVGFFLGGISGALGGIIILGPLWFFTPRMSKICPKCAEKVLLNAVVCKHCGHEFDEVEIKEKYNQNRDTQKAVIKSMATLLAALPWMALIALVIILNLIRVNS